MVTEIEIVISPSIIVNCEIVMAVLKNHASLENLDYAHSGHTGFASAEDLALKANASDVARDYVQWNNVSQDATNWTVVQRKQGGYVDIRVNNPYYWDEPANKNYVDGRHDELFRNNQIKAELIPGEFDEVMEFEKEVSGVNFLPATLATEIGSIVWCAATKAICGETYYRKFLVNNDGTQAGITTITPEKGKLYVGKTANNLFGWSGSNLLEISKSLSLGETATTAYAGNKGKANADAIAALQAKQIRVVGFYDSAYPQLNRLTFPTSQTQIIVFGYKYNSLDPIKGGSVPLFNDNFMELAPNSPDNEYFRVKAETSGNNTVLTIYQNLMSYVRFLVIETNVDLTGGA